MDQRVEHACAVSIGWSRVLFAQGRYHKHEKYSNTAITSNCPNFVALVGLIPDRFQKERTIGPSPKILMTIQPRPAFGVRLTC